MTCRDVHKEHSRDGPCVTYPDSDVHDEATTAVTAEMERDAMSAVPSAPSKRSRPAPCAAGAQRRRSTEVVGGSVRESSAPRNASWPGPESYCHLLRPRPVLSMPHWHCIRLGVT